MIIIDNNISLLMITFSTCLISDTLAQSSITHEFHLLLELFEVGCLLFLTQMSKLVVNDSCICLVALHHVHHLRLAMVLGSTPATPATTLGQHCSQLLHLTSQLVNLVWNKYMNLVEGGKSDRQCICKYCEPLLSEDLHSSLQMS